MRVRGYRTTGICYAKAERFAIGIRTHFNLGFERLAALPGMKFFDSLDDHLSQAGLPLMASVSRDVRPPEEARTYYEETSGVPWEAHGEASPVGRIVVELSERTFGGLEIGDPRARFSLYHETAHAWVHEPLLRRLFNQVEESGESPDGICPNSLVLPHNRGLSRQESDHAWYEDTEWQADAVAGALLMPARDLEWLRAGGALVPERVQECFHVSRAAADIRIEKFSTHRAKMLEGWISV